MKYRFLSLSKDLISMVMNYVVNLSILMAMAGAMSVEFTPLTLASLFLIPVIYYIVRKYVNNIALFTLIHIVTAAATIFSLKSDVKAAVIVGIIVVIFSVFSFVMRTKASEPGEKAYHPLAAALIMFTAILVLNYVGNETYGKVIPKFVLIYTTLYFCLLYIKRFIWFDFINRKVITHMPTKNLVKASAPYVAGLSVSYLIVGLVSLNEELIQSLSDWLKNLFNRFMIWLLSHAPEAAEEVKEVEEMPAQSNVMEEFGELSETSEPSWLLLLIEKILVYVTVVAAVLGLLFLIGFAIVKIIKHFKGIDKSASTELTEDYVEEREKVSEKVKVKKERPHIFKRPDESIRALFIKIAEKNKDITDRPEIFTARNFAEQFPDEKKENALGFAYIYEKARYSPDSCTKEDLKQAREYAVTLM